MKCNHCGREFKIQKRFESHKCEPKKRLEDHRTQKGQMAFEMFLRFEKFNPSSKKDPLKKFLASKQYRAFITLAEFFMKIKPLDSNEYFEYLIKSRPPFRKWTSEDFYFKWLKEKILLEDADSAISRSIETLIEFAGENKIKIHEVYSILSGNRLLLWLQTGRISPWFLVLSSKSDFLLSKLDSSMVCLIEEILNPLYWRIRIQKAENAKVLQNQLKDSDL